MSLDIKAIVDRGVPARERIVIEALSEDDVGKYMIFIPEISNDLAMSGKVHFSFWFPDRAISAGDKVVVYTKSGTYKKKDLDEGRVSHFFYWDLPEAKFSDPKSVVALARIEKWQRFPRRQAPDKSTEEP